MPSRKWAKQNKTQKKKKNAKQGIHRVDRARACLRKYWNIKAIRSTKVCASSPLSSSVLCFGGWMDFFGKTKNKKKKTNGTRKKQFQHFSTHRWHRDSDVDSSDDDRVCTTNWWCRISWHKIAVATISYISIRFGRALLTQRINATHSTKRFILIQTHTFAASHRRQRLYCYVNSFLQIVRVEVVALDWFSFARRSSFRRVSRKKSSSQNFNPIGHELLGSQSNWLKYDERESSMPVRGKMMKNHF